MRRTIKDVAKRAGVSIATVSRYINHSDYVSDDAKVSIKQAIKEINYHPPKHKLLNKANKYIAVILPSISNPLYAEFYEAICENLKSTKYEPILKIDDGTYPNFDPYLEEIKKEEIAGIIISSPLKMSKADAKRSLPIVSFDRHLDKVCLIHCNNLDGGYQIAQKVLTLGKKKILILAGVRNDLYPINNRIKGMLTVFNHYHADVKSNYLDSESSIAAKKIKISQILNNQEYDAVCCTDDVTALLVKNYADSINYHPLITGFDGSDFIHNIFPNLITVKQPIKDIAEISCKIVLRKISHPHQKVDDEFMFPVTLLD